MTEQTPTSQKHTAGALDIRNIIGGLLGVYGVILVLMGIFGDKELRQDRRRQRQPVGRPRAGGRGRGVPRLGAAQADRRARPRRPAGHSLAL